MSAPKVSNKRVREALLDISDAVWDINGEGDGSGKLAVGLLYIDPEVVERLCTELEAAARRLQPKRRRARR